MADKILLLCIEDNFYPAGPATITVGKKYWGIPKRDGFLITNDFGKENSWMMDSRFVVLPTEDKND